MVVIPAGSFQMGSSDNEEEQPVHKVTIATPFAMGKYPVMFDEYDAFALATKGKLPSDRGLIFSFGRGRRPVINVTWQDASAYAQWLSEETGKSYRLPIEAEWEYAARGGTTTRYWWGDDFDEQYANCNAPFTGKTSPVGSFPANPFGLSDTAGNV